MKKIAVFASLVPALAAAVLVSIPVATASGGTSASATFCGGDTATVTDADQIEFLNLAAAQGGFWVVQKDDGGNVVPYTGGTDLNSVLASDNTFGHIPDPGVEATWIPVAAGPCGAVIGAAVDLPRDFWGCTHPAQTTPEIVGKEGSARARYKEGVRVPYAVLDPLSKTKLNSGVYLVCKLPAGYAVKSGVAVSTGGGEMYDSTGTMPGAIHASQSYIDQLHDQADNLGDYTYLSVKQ